MAQINYAGKTSFLKIPGGPLPPWIFTPVAARGSLPLTAAMINLFFSGRKTAEKKWAHGAA